LLVILLIFGPRRLPEMARGIGQSVREFRKGIRDIKDDITKDDEDETPKRASHVTTVSSDATTPTAPTASTPPAENKTEVKA